MFNVHAKCKTTPGQRQEATEARLGVKIGERSVPGNVEDQLRTLWQGLGSSRRSLKLSEAQEAVDALTNQQQLNEERLTGLTEIAQEQQELIAVRDAEVAALEATVTDANARIRELEIQVTGTGGYERGAEISEEALGEAAGGKRGAQPSPRRKRRSSGGRRRVASSVASAQTV